MTVGVTPVAPNLPPGIYTCARCHMVPSPEILPRDRWRGAITRMNMLIEQYNLGEALGDADLQKVIQYYETHSAIALPTLPVEAGPPGREPPVAWQQSQFGFQEPVQPGSPIGPVIAGVTITDLDKNGRPDVLFSDAKNNVVTWVHQGANGPAEDPVVQVPAPSRTAVLDIDADGDLDVAIACLGSLQPTDNLVGSLVFLVNDAQGRLIPRTILSNEPRACDIRPADIDSDGDIDFSFATFGLYHTGRAGWIEQTAPMEFVAHDLVRANGVSHTPAGDINGDGRPDVVVLLSQQHEKVLLYVNEGPAGDAPAPDAGAAQPIASEAVPLAPSPVRFREIELWRAPHPMWGNSSADLIDLDRDGDLDVLFTNGDALDNEPYAKPWHGVQWLENKSEGEVITFEYHRIGAFNGAYWADAADFDADGDLDVVASSMMNAWQDGRRASVVWFENDGHQGFTLWPIPGGPTYQVVGDVGDMDRDGRPDFVTGGMYVYPPFFRQPARAWLWMSRPAPGAAAPARATPPAQPASQPAPAPPASAPPASAP